MPTILDYQVGRFELPKGNLSTPALPRKNLIINPNFRLWQRHTPGSGLSIASGQTHIADHWYGYGGGVTSSMWRAAMSPSNTYEALPGLLKQPRTCLCWSQSAISSGYGYLLWKVEDARWFAGGKATFSFYAAVASGSVTLNFSANQCVSSGTYYGASRSPSSFTIDTTWRRFTSVITWPSLSGRTLTDGNHLYLYVYTPVNSTPAFNLYAFGFQLEAGEEATWFEEPTDHDDYKECARFYCKTYDVDTPPGTATTVGALGMYTSVYSTARFANGHWEFPAVMRATPSVVAYTTAGTSGYWTVSGVNYAPSLYLSPERAAWELLQYSYTGRACGHLAAVAEIPY